MSQIAQRIWDEDMGERKRAEYVDRLWDSDDEYALRLFFGRKTYFLYQLDIELEKIARAGPYGEE